MLLTAASVGSSLPARALALQNTTATPPVVLFTNPSESATAVPTSINSNQNIVTGTTVSATFSLPMAPATIASLTAGSLLTFTLAGSTGVNIPGTVTLNATNTVATFTPALSALNSNTTYTATISTAATDTAGIAITRPVTWSFTTKNIPFTGQETVDLGNAGTFAILTKTGITDVYASAVNGNVGSSPITGAAIHLACAEVQTGTVYTVDATGPLPCRITNSTYLTAAIGDMQIAYTDAAGRSTPNFTELGSGEIGGLTLAPGLYKWGTDVSISGDVTLTGGPNDIWIFQVAGGITQASATRVTLAGGAVPKNIFWQTAKGAAIGTTAHFEGVLLAKTLIAVKTGATANGRLLAQTAVTLQQNAITQPAQ